MRVVAPLLVVLGHLLAASVHAVPSAACSEVMIWTEHEIDVYLNALPDDALRDCVQVALFSAVDGGRQDAVRFILNHPRCQVDGLTVTRVAWYAYARWRHNRISNAWRTLGDDLMPLLQSAYQLTGPDILRRFDVNYEVFPRRDTSRSAILQRTPFLANPPLVQEYNPYYDHGNQRSVQTPHLDFIRGAYQHQQVHQHEQPQPFVPETPATPRHAGQRSTRQPRGRIMSFARAGYDYQALEAGLIWLEPHPAFLQAALPRQTTHASFGTIQEIPQALSSLSSILTPVQLSPVESASRHRQHDGLESLRSQIRPAQPRSQRATAQAPAAPGANSNPNPNAQRPPRSPLRLYHAPYPQLRSNAVARDPESQPRYAIPQEPLSGSVPVPGWKYLLKDGTQQEQGQEFLNRVSGMIDQGDERLRGRLFVKSESSSAIDEGGLSASLIQFASAELVVRLGRDGQILYSQSMDRAFVPRSPTIETDDERKHLVLLGALIGIIDNHRRMGPNRVMSLPIPLPVVAFRALLADGALATITDDDARGTALAAVYKQYCGDRSPSQCNRDTQIDIVDLFPPVPGYDGDSAANEYLRGLTSMLLSSPAFAAVRRGYIGTARAPQRTIAEHRAMHQTVVADTIVTAAKLKPNIHVFVRGACCVPHANRAADNVFHVLARMPDHECVDFAEATTGARCLPLTRDIHSMIKVDLHHGDAIAFHTCFRTVEVPFAIARNRDLLLLLLRDAIQSVAGRGITSSTYNAA